MKYLSLVALLIMYCKTTLCATANGKKKAAAAAAVKETLKQSSPAKDRMAILSTKYLNQPIVSLTDSNFSRFITSRPRDYSAVIMFTALGTKYGCDICTRVLSSYTEVAKYSQNQYDFNSSSLDNRLAFFIVDVEHARNTFQDMQLETVPRFFVLPPRQENSPKLKMGDFEFEVQKALEGSSGIIKEINKLTNMKIVATIDPKPLLVLVCIVAVLIAFFVSIASVDVYNAFFWYRNKYLWMTISVVSYYELFV